ncbi:ESPR-type extended signal peptide-containing protein, partial [Burkholderia pseudomallei]|uniref:ESPR-type extended signal peptide-containing protein n=1 Tax=Burkholderia pseudomallei TaxID=28450 RepID=UPI0022871310
MNKIFRVIWCRVKAACVVVSEEACLRGGKSHSCRQGSRAAGEESVRFALSSIALAACILIGSFGSTLPAVAGTVIGGGAQSSNWVGGTSSTTGDLGNSYIGASGMGTAITGDNDCLSLTSTRNVLNSANVGWLLGTTSQTTDPGPLYPGSGTENNQTISYSGTSNFSGGGNSAAGVQATLAWGFNSFAAGCGNKSLGMGSSTLGLNNMASLAGSTAIGIANTASGAGGTAIGLHNPAA